MDSELYDRQLRAYGLNSLKNISESKVIIKGLSGGLATELTKNLALTGVKKLYLLKDNKISIKDSINSFYFTNDDVGKNREDILKDKLSELNPYLEIFIVDELSENILTNGILICCNINIIEAIKFNNLSRKYNTKFILVNSSGVFGFIFTDGGFEHIVEDKTGEVVDEVQIGSIDKDGLVVCAKNSDHNFQTNDHVKLTNLEGDNLDKVKDCYKIEVISRTRFKLKEYQNDNINIVNGNIIFIPEETKFNYNSLEVSLESNDYVGFDIDRSKKIVNFYKSINIDNFDKSNCKDFEDIKDIVKSFGIEIPPVISLFGSLACSEAIKFILNKYTPINQFWTFDDTKLLTDNLDINSDNIFDFYGKEFNEKIKKLNLLLVGCGAIGCEWLKLLSQLNISTEGSIFVTDPDHIEKSNLSRQFLFRSNDVSKSKSKVARSAIKKMNDKINIIAYEEKLCNDNIINTEKLFNNRDIIINALDNIKARKFVDSLCFDKKLPLFESGTMGMKGNIQPVIPFITETYSNSNDPVEEKSIPQCTLKHFPNQITHTIHWARDYFDFFRRAPDNINKYNDNNDFVESLNSYEKNQALSDIKLLMVDNSLNSWKECANLASEIYCNEFINNINVLLNNFPEDSLNDDGTNFWSGGKRCPKPLKFDITNDLCYSFIEATTKLLCDCMIIDSNFDKDNLVEHLKNYVPKEFDIENGKKVPKNDEEMKKMNDDDEEIKLPKIVITKSYKSQEFEKDDDSNYHIAFITAASNCRATNYNIENKSYYETKGIAGRIIPAIATTTSIVVSLIGIELLKYLLNNNTLEDYRSWFINLADNTYVSAEPIKAPMIKFGEKEINSWTKFELNEDISLTEFMNKYNNMFNCKINMILYESSIIHADFNPSDNLDSNLSSIFKQNYDINLGEREIQLIIDCDEEIDLPTISLKLSN